MVTPMFRSTRMSLCSTLPRNTSSALLLLALVQTGPAHALSGQIKDVTPPVIKIQFFNKDPDPSEGQELANQVVRIDRLENQIRTLNGQIEQMQYDLQKMQDQLKRAQELTDQSSTKQPSRPNVPTSAPSIAPAPTAPSSGRRGDAFDPASDPNAIGAPKTLGTLSSNQPLDLNPDHDGEDQSAFPAKSPAATAAPIAGVTSAPSVINAPSPSDNYEIAMTAFKQSQWSEAQNGFRAFINQNPSDKLVPDALFYIGQSYDQMGRSRDAAENYLKVSTDYSKSPRAPEAMVKLGFALEKLGAKEQACATFGEALRKYPSMPASIKTSAERESKRAQC